MIKKVAIFGQTHSVNAEKEIKILLFKWIDIWKIVAYYNEDSEIKIKIKIKK